MDPLRKALTHFGVSEEDLSELVPALEAWKSGDDSQLEACCGESEEEEAPPSMMDRQKSAVDKAYGEKNKPFPFTE